MLAVSVVFDVFHSVTEGPSSVLLLCTQHPPFHLFYTRRCYWGWGGGGGEGDGGRGADFHHCC